MLIAGMWMLIIGCYITLLGAKVRCPKDLTLFLLGVVLFPLAGVTGEKIGVSSSSMFVAIFVAAVIVGVTRRQYEIRKTVIVRSNKPDWVPAGYQPTPPKAGVDARRRYSPKNEYNNGIL